MGGAHWPRLLMDTSAILRKMLLMQILQKQNETDRVRKKVLHSDFNCNTISGKNCPEAFLSCFKLRELVVIPVLVNTILDT